MPYGDRTGPDARGSRTGRQLGYCAGYDSPGYTKGIPQGMQRGGGFARGRSRGGGFGRGGSFGRGRSFGFFETPGRTWVDQPVVNEKERLESSLKNLKSEIELIEKRLKEVSKAMEEKEDKE
jgi:hypothetical protein